MSEPQAPFIPPAPDRDPIPPAPWRVFRVPGFLPLFGAQFISMGFLAELFTAYYGRATVPYSIKDRAGRWPGDAKDE